MTLTEIAKWRASNRQVKLVVTNGCFDILHVGHTRFLKKAKMLGNCLVVGLNSDKSVRELKGDSRPIFPVAERAEMLKALIWVDFVFIFHEKRATRFLRTIKPDIWAKGGDYTLDTLDLREKQAVLETGGKIEIIPLQSEWSTSKILNHDTKVGWVT